MDNGNCCGEYLLAPTGMAMFVLNLEGPSIEVHLEANFVRFANGSRHWLSNVGSNRGEGV